MAAQMSLARKAHLCVAKPRSRVVVHSSPRLEPFNETAAQVKRLISRDRKEFLGNDEDILDKYTTEFGETSATSTASTSKATPANPFKSGINSDNPFGSAPSSSPFGSSPAPKPPRSTMEPVGLKPDMSPDPIVKEKAFNLLESITVTQVVIALSFTLIVSLMLATCYFVFSVGAIRLNGV